MTGLICFFLISNLVYATDYLMISDVGTSAETIGAGNVEGFNYAASTVFENPAGLQRISNQSISMFTTKVMNEVSYSNMAYAIKTKKGTFGVGFMLASVYDAPSTIINQESADKEIVDNGTYDYQSVQYKLSYARTLKENLHIGVSTTFYDVKLDTIHGHGNDFDSGILYKKGEVDYSLFARNFLPFRRIEYSNDQAERLPFQIVGSLRYPIKSFEIMPQLRYQQRNILPSLGVVYTPTMLPFVNFSAGYRQHLTTTNENRQNLTCGIGLNLYGLYFNFAYERSDYIPLDNKSYFSINAFF